jgi:hypothetical protein
MKNPIARRNNIVIKKLDEETLIYDLKINKAICLNMTSARIFHLCNGTRTVSQIAKEMSLSMKTPIGKEFVMLAIEQFSKDHLLENKGETTKFFNRLSRRELIRKVGFGSAVALPLVSSVIAPQSAAAQSCLLAGDASIICPNTAPGCVPNPSPSGPFPTSLCPNPSCCSGTCEGSPLFNDACI